MASHSYGPTRAAGLGEQAAPVCVVMVETTTAVVALPRILEVDDFTAMMPEATMPRAVAADDLRSARS